MAGLQWIRLDTTFFDNNKIADLVDTNQHRVIITHLSAMCHAGKTGTDGYIRENALRRFAATRKDGQVLVDSGLWIPAPGGWNINDWAEYQVSDDAARKRSDDARRAALSRWHGQNGAACEHT
jgi:hypothetical protein